MPVISHKLNLVYFDIPKVACTSLKTLLWELENGRPFDQIEQQSLRRRIADRIKRRKPAPRPDIHYTEGYRTWSFRRAQQLSLPEDYDRITVLRDPIARLYSAWSNKATNATFARRDELEDLRNEGLADAPSFQEYLRDFERYQAISRPVRVHTMPYAWHLGPDLSAYQHSFKMEEIAELQTFLSDRYGSELTLPRANRTHGERQPPDLTPADIDKLIALTKSEYAWLGGRYDPNAGLAALLKPKTDAR